MKLRRLLCLSILTLAMAGSATASPILFEDFNYPIGPLDGQNGGIGWAGSWVGADVYDVASGSLSYPGLQNSGNRAQFVPTSLAGTNVLRTISSFGPAGSTFWLSFLMRYDGTVGQTTADVRLDSSNGYVFIGRFLRDQDNWGVEDTVSPVTNRYSSIPIVSGDTLFVAVRIDLNANPNLNDTVTVYFDPTPAAVPSASPGVPGFVFNDLNFAASNIAMALDGAAFPSPTTFPVVVNYDPIRGGTSYFDVAPGTSSPVPEPATWSIVAMGLAFLAITARRRKGREHRASATSVASRSRSRCRTLSGNGYGLFSWNLRFIVRFRFQMRFINQRVSSLAHFRSTTFVPKLPIGWA